MRNTAGKVISRMAGLAFIVGLVAHTACNNSQGAPQGNGEKGKETMSAENTELATFGGGCFWCVEAVFERLDGVVAVESGYCGGTVKNPSYEQVCSGTTGHAEVVQVRFDPSKIGFEELLQVFFKTHDPTTKNRQGNDIGTQYRSAVFYHNDRQKQQAEQYIKKLDATDEFKNPIVTEVAPIGDYYTAEQYHQDYFRLNPNQGYCRAMIPPKLEKLEKHFKEKLKDE